MISEDAFLGLFLPCFLGPFLNFQSHSESQGSFSCLPGFCGHLFLLLFCLHKNSESFSSMSVWKCFKISSNSLALLLCRQSADNKAILSHNPVLMRLGKNNRGATMRLGTTNIYLLCAINLFITGWDFTAHLWRWIFVSTCHTDHGLTCVAYT